MFARISATLMERHGDYDLVCPRNCFFAFAIGAAGPAMTGRTKFNNDKRPRWMYSMMVNAIIMSSNEFIFLEMAQ
jgi:hypothetical protein